MFCFEIVIVILKCSWIVLPYRFWFNTSLKFWGIFVQENVPFQFSILFYNLWEKPKTISYLDFFHVSLFGKSMKYVYIANYIFQAFISWIFFGFSVLARHILKHMLVYVNKLKNPIKQQQKIPLITKITLINITMKRITHSAIFQS